MAVVVALVLVGGGAGSIAGVAAADRSGGGQYSVVQGDECTTISPLGIGLQTVEEFYGYRSPDTNPRGLTYSAHGTTHLQRPNTSLLFLYEGKNGVGLVLVHGKFGDSADGLVSMRIDGLPEEGEWIVEDDNYTTTNRSEADDIFLHEGPTSRIAWVYQQDRTDGAAFRGGLQNDFEITIDPRFNDVVDNPAAEQRRVDSNVSDWQVLSETDGGDVARTSLDTNEPVTLRSGPCPSAMAQLRALLDTDTIVSASGLAIGGGLVALAAVALLVLRRR